MVDYDVMGKRAKPGDAIIVGKTMLQIRGVKFS